MKLTKRISSAIRAFRSFEDYDEAKWLEWTQGPLARSGIRVNEVSSLNISGIYAAVNFIAGTIASMPKVIYRQLPNGGKIRAFEHPLYDRLHNKPNSSDLTSWQWIFTSIVHKYLWGNWYTWINTDSYKNRELIPLLPDKTHIDPFDRDVYITRTEKLKYIRIPRSQMLHIPHFSFDGIEGRGVVYFARESLGIARALDEFAGAFFGNGVHPGGFVEVDPGMKEETRKELQKDFNEKYRGLGKMWKVIFLAGGKFNPEEIDPGKAQALESRQFSIVEVARWMNLPPHILRELSRATFSNIEQQGIELVIYSLLPITTQIEQAMNIAFFDEEERRDHFIKFELKGLLRGDLKTRTEFYNAMLDRGVFNADMVLDLEDMNPQPGGLGQVFIVPLNMVNKKLIVSPQPLTIESKSRPEIESRTVQIVERRTSALRRKLTIAYKVQFDEYGKRIVKLEVDEVRSAVDSLLKKRGITDFLSWLESFYPEFSKEIDMQAAPLITSYASAVLPIAQDEVGSDSDISIQYQDFQREYREYFTDRHIKSSKGQLQAVVAGAQEAGDNEAEAVLQRLEEWEERRPDKISMRESVRAESAFARSVFGFCGIMKIKSIAFGTNCPYCSALNGKVIGINEYFLTKGDFQPDGADKPLTVTSNRSHPPYHDGCDCGIESSN